MTTLFSFLYNCVLFLSLVLFPKRWLGNPFSSPLAWQRAKERLRGKSLSLPSSAAERIWVHAVSFGEVRAVAPLVKKWKEEDPHRQLIVTVVTETGMEEAVRALSFADAIFFFPIDFSWTMRRLIKQIAPTHIFLSETDFWFHFLHFAKRKKAKIALLNGKISGRSAARWSRVPRLGRAFFSLVDRFCVQDSTYEKRFLDCGVDTEKMRITSNLKFDAPLSPIPSREREEKKRKWGISSQGLVLTAGSTHPSEEEMLLPILQNLMESFPDLAIFLVPRHPHRAKEVSQLLSRKHIPFKLSSRKEQMDQRTRMVLVDEMGLLNSLYQISDAALVGGSFVSGIGGHNIFEPCYCGAPVFFGPFMEQQQQMVQHVLFRGAGKQGVADEAGEAIARWLSSSEEREAAKNSALSLREEMQGAGERTRSFLSDLFAKSS